MSAICQQFPVEKGKPSESPNEVAGLKGPVDSIHRTKGRMHLLCGHARASLHFFPSSISAACNAPASEISCDAADESDCAARDRPDRTDIRSAAAVAASAKTLAASAITVAAPAVAVAAAPAVAAAAAICTSFATGALFSALPALYPRATCRLCSGDGREARPHN